VQQFESIFDKIFLDELIERSICAERWGVVDLEDDRFELVVEHDVKT
jgi:hypothetical protein